MHSSEPEGEPIKNVPVPFGRWVIRAQCRYRHVYFVLSGIFAAIVAVCFMVPWLNEPGYLIDLNGTVGIMDHTELWNTLDPFSQLIYSIGDYTCHQSDGRTLHLNGNDMPICIRDTFIFMGFSIGFLLHGLGYSVRNNGLLVGIVLVVFTPVEWAFEHFLDISIGSVRAIVSIVSGIGATVMFNSILMWETAFFDSLAAKKKKP